MRGPFVGKNIVLGVTGSIAAYKTVELASYFTQKGARVSVLMTEAATKFVSPLTFKSITHQPVISDLFENGPENGIAHVDLAHDADLIIVAPATANTIAKLAYGFADDPISVVALATTAPMLIAPAMDGAMWSKDATRDNVDVLRSRGAMFASPQEGHLASGLVGWGRFATVDEIIGRASVLLGRNGDLAGQRIVVTAGGTREPIDPVRIITNRSSGKMGFAIAEAARDRGALVILITGPTILPDMIGVKTFRIETTADLREHVLDACFESDALVMAAAVSDYRPSQISVGKIKKASDKSDLTLALEQNADFFHEIPEGIARVGFAAETQSLVKNATSKLTQKSLDLIVANDVTRADSGFDVDTNKVTFIDKSGAISELPTLPKYEVAWELLDRLKDILDSRPSQPRPLP